MEIRDQLLKIKELAERGEDGEMLSARTMLEKLLRKHNMTLADLEDETIHKCVYKVPRELYLVFLQCYGLAISKKTDIKVTIHPIAKSAYIIYLTNEQQCEMVSLYNFHSAQFKRELDKATDDLKKKRKQIAKKIKDAQSDVFTAYLMKHHLYISDDTDKSDDKSGKKLTQREINNILRHYDGLDDVSYHKQLKQS